MLTKMMAQEETTTTIEDTTLSIIELVKLLMLLKVKQGTTMKKTPQVKLVSCHTSVNLMEGVLLLQTATIKMRIHLDNLATIMRMKMMQDLYLDAMTVMRKKSLGSSSSPCPSSKERKTPMHTCLGSSRLTRYSASTTSQKVAMASLEFEGYANVWWEEVNKKRDKEDLEPIDTWEEMQEVMHKRFVPTHHKRDLFNKLTQLKQSFKSVEEYYKEMHMTMMWMSEKSKQWQDS
ncbi:hypothetical protein QYE76_058194 [Lolium multiflorum]|uniref:Retrotransposon gag domain-containing protein n=1 Tax=Lolium multiflorum TaxID=4521 RepID=A0AAD8T6L6_LOLMU|nr:hypothetical protein QYE76_058194 [Lolium multiflorum]